MRDKLYRFLWDRAPRAGERYQARRLAGVPKWRAVPPLLAAAAWGEEKGGLPLPPGGESRSLERTPPEALAEELSRFDGVSWDVFDTLLLRCVDRPEDAFFLVGAKLGYPDFQRLRVEAERLARKRKEQARGTGEVTLREIWEQLERTTALDPDQGMAAELEVERALCRGNPYFLPVVERLRSLGKPLVLTTDMYLPGEFVQELVEQAGFGRFEGCLVSGEEGVSKGEGCLFHRLRQRFPPGALLAHVGDNPHSDGERARANGVTPFLYQNAQQAGDSFRVKDMSQVLGSVYRGLANGRLHSGADPCSPLYEYGFVYGGLFALGYCRFIREQADLQQADRLLFLSRDGEVLLELYRRLYPEDPRPVYAYWSRLAAAKVTAGLFPGDYFRRFLWHKAEGAVPVWRAVASMELTPLLPELCARLGLSPDKPLTHKTARAIQDYLTEAWDRVLALYGPQRQAAGAYYRQLLEGCRRAVAVDIGWAGSGALSLGWAAKRLWGLECEITGLVAGTNSAHSPERDAAEPLLLTGRLKSYLFSQGENRDLWKVHHPGKGHNLFWELLLGGEEGSLKGIYPGPEGGWRLELGENPQKEAVREIHRGMLDFAREFTGLEERLGFHIPISGRDAYAPMLDLLEEKNTPYRRRLEALLDEPGIG